MSTQEEFIELIRLLKEKRVILFIGAGVPASLGMPTWSDLVRKMGDDLGINSDEFIGYGDYLQLASYYENIKGSKKMIQDYIKEKSKEVNPYIKDSIIYNSICKLNFRKIYTTNYDHILEVAYHINKIKHTTIRTIDDFSKISLDPQIIKYHGDIDYARNFVLSEFDYFERLDFNHPFDIKLKSDLIGNSILFIGYSFTDLNIRYLVYKINKIWEEHKMTKNVKSFIFLSNSNPIKENILRSYGIIPISNDGENLKSDLEEFLTKLVENMQD